MNATVTSWKPVEFPSAGATLRGRLYGQTDPPAPAPVVVMAHGFSATISGMVADDYAAAFAAAGLRVLLYDHFSLGLSDGEPRSTLDPWLQARGYLDAVAYLRSRDDVDADRIAVWGDSMSGKLAMIAAAVDGRVAAVVVQVPACGNDMPEPAGDTSAFETLRDQLLHADLASFDRSVSEVMPVVSPDQTHMPSHLKPITAFRWFIHFGARYETGWQNRATVANLATDIRLDAALAVPYLDAPTLMVTSHHDEMPRADADVARAVLAGVRGPATSVEVGGGHFGLLYPGTPAFATSVEAQREFLVRHLRQ